MVRRIIEIDEALCNGCGICAEACHEGAIGMVDGKARLLRDDYCDGLGDCLPACPVNAIRFVQREAAEYDAEAVAARMAAAGKAHTLQAAPHPAQAEPPQPDALPCGCPGSAARSLRSAVPEEEGRGCNGAEAPASHPGFGTMAPPAQSQLAQWPVQIKLVPPNAPYFNGAKLLVAADCTAFAYASFHGDFMRGRVTLIGCPKLDMVDYSEKLTEILKNNDIKSVDIVRMEVPCCGGIENAVKQALVASGKMIPWQCHTISTDGRLLA